MDNQIHDRMQAIYEMCAIIGDRIKTRSPLPEHTKDWIATLQVEILPAILAKIQSDVKEVREKFPPREAHNPKNIRLQDSITKLDKMDSALQGIGVLREYLPNQIPSRLGIEPSAHRTRSHFDRQIRMMHKEQGLTEALVRQTLQEKSRSSASKEGRWVSNALEMTHDIGAGF